MSASKQDMLKQLENAPNTSNFRLFKSLAHDDITWLKMLSNTSVQDIKVNDLHDVMQKIAIYREAIYQISDKGEFDNPYASIEPQMDLRTSEYQPNSNNYQHYLETLLPNLTGEQFYTVWRYDYLSSFSLIDGACTLAVLILEESPINYDELKDVWDIFLYGITKFEAIVLASAEFEEQQFGEQ